MFHNRSHRFSSSSIFNFVQEKRWTAAQLQRGQLLIIVIRAKLDNIHRRGAERRCLDQWEAINGWSGWCLHQSQATDPWRLFDFRLAKIFFPISFSIIRHSKVELFNKLLLNLEDQLKRDISKLGIICWPTQKKGLSWAFMAVTNICK